jgi:hypothetical protein
MKTLNATLLLILTLVTTTVFANNGNDGTTTTPAPRRIMSNAFLFTESVKGYTDMFVKNERSATALKVCSCQILNVSSNNEEAQQVVVLAEKTNNGNISSDLRVAGATIETAKKQMKGQFYNSVKVVSKQQAALPCAEMYNQLKIQNGNMKLYEILDADILSRKK